MDAHDRDRDDGELLVFGGSLCNGVRRLKNNDPKFKRFLSDGRNTEHYSDRGWELLGRYIADNDYLTDLDIKTYDYIGGTQLSLLCRTMVGSRSLETLELEPDDSNEGFSLEPGCIQSLIPFLENSPNLTNLTINNSPDTDSSCFDLLVRMLDGRPINRLIFSCCNVDDLTALQDCTFSHLEMLIMDENEIRLIPSLEKYTNLNYLNLSSNNIGKEGCQQLAELLQNESSSLRKLYLAYNDIDDEAAEILANSIKHNTMLTNLYLDENIFKEAGCRAFLKLINDSSSIEQTYNSNHTLQQLGLLPCQTSSTISTYIQHIDFALKINRQNRGDSHATGRAKVVATQLNSATRKELCRLQGIEYSLSNLLSDVEPALLPDLLALTGREHGRSEFYRMLIASAPDLTSLIDERSMLKELIAQKTRQIANLTSEILSLNQRLEAFTRAESAKERLSTNGCENKKKRRRAGS